MRIIFFDLDGTITRRDSLLPYVMGWLLRRPWTLPKLLLVIPAALRFVLAGRDHGALKGSLIHFTQGGCTGADIERWNAIYVPGLLRKGLFTAAVAQLEQHRRAGDHLILMSASVDLYVPEVGRALGFHETFCTPVTWNGARLDGALAGPNCRAEEKVRRLQAVRVKNPGCEIIAYGNSSPDLPHLIAADHAVLVNGGAALRRHATQAGIECVIWR